MERDFRELNSTRTCFAPYPNTSTQALNLCPIKVLRLCTREGSAGQHRHRNLTSADSGFDNAAKVASERGSFKAYPQRAQGNPGIFRALPCRSAQPDRLARLLAPLQTTNGRSRRRR